MFDETHEGCPRSVFGASCRTAREARGPCWAVVGLGSGLPGAGQGRDHGEVRQGVHEGVEEGQGTDS